MSRENPTLDNQLENISVLREIMGALTVRILRSLKIGQSSPSVGSGDSLYSSQDEDFIDEINLEWGDILADGNNSCQR